MGSRIVPFDKDAVCDECGQIGAYDFMGDFLCGKCAHERISEDTKEVNMRVFISGPYSAKHPRDVLRNVDAAIKCGIKIMQMGHDVFIPHLWHYVHLHPDCPFEYEEYIKNDMAWLEVSDAVFRLPGESKGADLEVARAKELGIPVFYDIDELKR